MRQADSPEEKPQTAHAVSENAPKNKPDLFTRFCSWTAKFSGNSITFCVAVFTIVAWMVTGPMFHYSDTWQLVINTSTTIVTFLMVFLIQNTQNRDSEALHLKLDELIRTTKGARNKLIELEDQDQKTLDAQKQEFETLAEFIQSDD